MLFDNVVYMKCATGNIAAVQKAIKFHDRDEIPTVMRRPIVYVSYSCPIYTSDLLN